MAYFPFQPGQQPMSSSQGVVIASDQSPVSVTGTINANINNSSVQVVGVQPPHSVATLQGTNPWIIGNSSVMLTPGINVIGSVAALQGTNPWVVGNSSVQVVGSVPPSSVSGVGLFNVNHTGNGSVQAVLLNSSVAALQGTNPWKVELTSGSVITTGGNSSVQVVGQVPPSSVSGVGIFNVNHTGNGSIILAPTSIAALQGTNPWTVQLTSGSIATTVNTGNSSVQLLGGNAAIGSVTTLQGTNPWITQPTSGSIFSYQAAGSVLAVSGTFSGGNSSVQVVGQVPPTSVSGVGQFNVNHNGNGSVLTVSLGSIATAPFPASVSGVGLFNINHVGNGSIILAPTSVAVLQGTNPWVVGNSSVQVINPVMSVVGGFVRTEDNSHASGDLGLFVLAVRNDTVASTTSADRDYSAFMVDAPGRVVTKPFAPEESRIYGVASTVNTGPSSLIAAAGAGLRNYITDIMVANTGSVATLVSFRDGDASVIGRTIAPGGGGSNMINLATPMRTHAFNSQVEYTAATAVSVLHVTAFGFKAP